MRMMVEFDRDDIQKRLPYMLLWETHSSARWQTGRRKNYIRNSSQSRNGTQPAGFSVRPASGLSSQVRLTASR